MGRIQTIGIIGFGALGSMYGAYLTEKLGKDRVFILADHDRIARYRKEKVYVDDKEYDLNFTETENCTCKPDLLIFAVKFGGFAAAVEEVRPLVKEDTVMISLLNGISSERILIEEFGPEHVLYCTAQGMDALKTGNHMYYRNMGTLWTGTADGTETDDVKAVDDVFSEAALPHEVHNDMLKRLWGKLLLNTGVNQAVTVYETDFGGVQKKGAPRDVMIAAMKEVIRVACAEGVSMSDDAYIYWVDLVDRLNPKGKPSMRQDMEAGRMTEVDLFSGTIRALGEKDGVATPVNDLLYLQIKRMESLLQMKKPEGKE